jgi:LPXTG-site transpeptidase (sortase) family protein
VKLKPAYFLLGVAVAFAVAIVITTVLGGGDKSNDAATANGLPVQGTVEPSQLPKPSQDLKLQPVVRLVIPDIEVDAPVITMGVDPDGTMQSPSTPLEVAWYDFSSEPGGGGNVVLAGHLDYVNYGPAVFFNLRKLEAGDEIQLVLADQTTAKYVVTSTESYDAATAPVQAIVGPTDAEVVTLITCGGSFDKSSREYNQRLVVRGDRVVEGAMVAQ